MLFRNVFLTTLLATFGNTLPVASAPKTSAPKRLAGDGEQYLERRHWSSVGFHLLGRAAVPSKKPKPTESWAQKARENNMHEYEAKHHKSQGSVNYYGGASQKTCEKAKDKAKCQAFFTAQVKNDKAADVAAGRHEINANKVVELCKAHPNAEACVKLHH